MQLKVDTLGLRRLGGPRSERGAVATIFAALMATGVIFGFVALSVDVGNLMSERRQVQNGATATAMALAIKCAGSALECAPGNGTLRSTLDGLNNGNALDGQAQFNPGLYPGSPGQATGWCIGNAPAGASLPPCVQPDDATALADLAQCPPLPPWVSSQSLPYVETHTLTKSASGNVLPSVVSRALLGVPDRGVPACGRAAWGTAAPTSQTVLNVVISECDWSKQTGYTGTPGSATYPDGPVYQAGAIGYNAVPSNPGYGPGTWPTKENAIYSKGNPTTCDTSSPGGTAPGGFATLTTTTGCQSTLTLGPDKRLWAQGEPGAAIPCSDTQLNTLLGTVVYLPIFDCMTDAPVTVSASTDCRSGNGSHNYYRISGFSAFYVSGWFLASSAHASIRPPGAMPCSSGARCVSGWFLADMVQDVPLSPPPSGTPSYGLLAVKSAG